MKRLTSIALGLVVVLTTQAEGHQISCRTSWYGAESGRRTASGERFDPRALTAAHRSIAFGTMIGVRHGSRKITVRVNDRGPARWTGRCLDLSRGAAAALGILGAGTALVTIERR